MGESSHPLTKSTERASGGSWGDGVGGVAGLGARWWGRRKDRRPPRPGNASAETRTDRRAVAADYSRGGPRRQDPQRVPVVAGTVASPPSSSDAVTPPRPQPPRLLADVAQPFLPLEPRQPLRCAARSGTGVPDDPLASSEALATAMLLAASSCRAVGRDGRGVLTGSTARPRDESGPPPHRAVVVPLSAACPGGYLTPRRRPVEREEMGDGGTTGTT